MKKMIANVLVAAALTITAGLMLPTDHSFAQSNDNVNSLRLSPLRTDIKVEPGEAVAVTVYVQNMTERAVTYQPIANDFVAQDENGTPGLLLNEGEFAKSRSLKRFMTVPSNITVQPKERATVNVRIAVPEDAKAGGYFGAIRFAPLDAAGNAQVNLTGSAASLILLTVPGDLEEKLVLETFEVRQDENSKSWFSSPKNLDVLLRFKNEGNVQVTPFGKIIVYKGDKEVYSANVNDQDPAGQTLPESVRRWSIPLDRIGKFGKYTVTATIGYGSEGQTISQERTIWIIPMSLIIAVLGGIVAIVFLVIFLPRLIRRYNQRVIRNSRGGRKR